MIEYDLSYYPCLRCGQIVQVCGSKWCKDCWYPGIDEEYNEYRELMEEGHSSHQAAVLSGWKGAEEV